MRFPAALLFVDQIEVIKEGRLEMLRASGMSGGRE
jgi:hypothetical protein